MQPSSTSRYNSPFSTSFPPSHPYPTDDHLSHQHNHNQSSPIPRGRTAEDIYNQDRSVEALLAGEGSVSGNKRRRGDSPGEGERRYGGYGSGMDSIASIGMSGIGTMGGLGGMMDIDRGGARMHDAYGSVGNGYNEQNSRNPLDNGRAPDIHDHPSPSSTTANKTLAAATSTSIIGDFDHDPKRRKIQRACDHCRRKKIRCDGSTITIPNPEYRSPVHTPNGAGGKGKKGKGKKKSLSLEEDLQHDEDGVGGGGERELVKTVTCSNCVEAKLECTYVEAAKRRGPPVGYVEVLEWRCKKLEELVAKLDPRLDIVKECGPKVERETFEVDQYKRDLEELGIPFITPGGRTKLAKVLGIGGDGKKGNTAGSVSGRRESDAPGAGAKHYSGMPEREEAVTLMALSTMGGMNDTPWPAANGGGSRPPSGMDNLDTKPNIPGGSRDGKRKEAAQRDAEEEKDVEQANSAFFDQIVGPNIAEGYRYLGKSAGIQLLRSTMDYKNASGCASPSQSTRRMRYWALPIWEATVSSSHTNAPDYSRFPDADLARKLIDAYFETDNLILPILNRLIFEHDWHSGRWKTDTGFAKLCLTMFALAAKSVDDPRCLWHADDPIQEAQAMQDYEMYRHSAGWRWAEMAAKMGKSFFKPPELEDLQVFVLFAQFLMRSAVISAVWSVAGIGLKHCIDIGMHTRVGLRRCKSRAESELYARAFYALLLLDRYTCACMGRTLSLQDEDYDADLPTDVDDEYWENGDFVQPPGKPSKVSAFIQWIKLHGIVAYALKTVFAVNKTARGRTTSDPDQLKQVITELDSDLSSWLDSVPSHLRWDPDRADNDLYQQSYVLNASYYTVQIIIHRPFIPNTRSNSSVAALALPSLAICTNAARSIARIAESVSHRGLPIQHNLMFPLFTSAIVQLVGVWGGNKLGTSIQFRTNTLQDVRSCVTCLKMLESSMRGAGRLRDLLMEMANLTDASIETPTPGPSAADASRGDRNGRTSSGASPMDSTAAQSSASDRGGSSAARPSAPSADFHLTQPQARASGSHQGATSTQGQYNSAPTPWWLVPPESGMPNLYDAAVHPSLSNGMNGFEQFQDNAPAPNNANASGFGQQDFNLANSLSNILSASKAAMFQGQANPGYGQMDTSINYAMPQQQNQQANPVQQAPAPDPLGLGTDFWSLGDNNNADMSGALYEIWGQAPNTFELDQWSQYLSQGLPTPFPVSQPNQYGSQNQNQQQSQQQGGQGGNYF